MFITFEGGEGSGKSTVIKAVSEFLTAGGIENIITREPGGTKISEDIRDIILDSRNRNISAETEALLFAAARTQHLKEVILPALREKKFVLCDRYLDSNLAYQGYARGLGIQEVLEINRFATKHMPDYTIYIDTDPKESLIRVFKRDEKNRLDMESLFFHKEVREGYLQLSKNYPHRYIVIDGDCSLNQLVFRVIKEMKKIIKVMLPEGR